MDKSQCNMQKTSEMIIDDQTFIKFIPRLKKNKKIELKWGQEYYTALQDAVFSIKKNSYVPCKMPGSLHDDQVQLRQNYLCKSCGDIFYFQSSFNDHHSRHSYILGYWCNYCFQIQCNHTSDKKLLCHQCHIVSKSKREYLRTKGLRKGQKVGAILLFYNQCQFFEHLKKHCVTVVDMSDIMLMPLPHNIQHDEYSQLEYICKVLMEYMFINRIHIMDWLRINKIDWKWWKTEPENDNPIGELLREYHDNFSNITKTNLKSKVIDKNSTAIDVDEQLSESSEDDDNPCDTEISFINFDLAKNSVINSEKNNIKELLDIDSFVNKPSASLASISEMNEMNKEKNNEISCYKNNILISEELEINDKKNLLENNRMTSPLSVNSDISDTEKNQIVSKNLSCMNISNRNVIIPSGVKILFKQLQNPTTNILNVDFDNNSIPLVTPKFNIVKNKLKIYPTKIVTSNSEKIDDSDGYESTKSIENPSTLIDNNSKIVLGNSKEIISSEKIDVESNFTINNNRKEFEEVKDKLQLEIIAPNNDVNNLEKINVNQEYSQCNSVKFCLLDGKNSIILKYRESMEKNLEQSENKFIQLIINNINDVNKKYQITNKCVDIKNIIAKNSIAIKKFEKYLNKSTGCNANINNDDKIIDKFDDKLCEWELNYNKTMIKPECIKCRCKLKPINYIIGISKSATNEMKFCQCYNYICYICNSKLGNIDRYQAHIRFHKKEMPYVCPECYETFATMYHLETHIWTKCYHIMTQQFFSCQVCEVEGFVTMEDVTRHYAHVHTHTAIFCNECQQLFNTYSDYQMHCLNNHTDNKSMSDPVRFLICEFGRCLVKPENFHTHIHTHIEIAKVTYYTCPFCSFIIKDIATNRQIIQNHVLGKHASRLREVITQQTAKFLTGKCKYPRTKQNFYVTAPATVPTISTTTTTTCSITSEVLEQASCSEKKLTEQDNTKVLEIIETRSDNIDVNSQDDTSPFKLEENNEKKLYIDKTEDRIEHTETLIAAELNSKTDINCDNVTKNDTDNIEVIAAKLNGNEETITIEQEIQSKTKTEPFVKEENLDSDLLSASQQQQQQQLLSITMENNSSLHSNSTSSIVETKIEEMITNESSSDNNEFEIRDLPMKCKSSPTTSTKEKVTKKIMSNIQLSIKQKRRQKRPWKIALNSPNDSNIPPIIYRCHLCSELISTSWSIVNNHFNTKHSSDYKVTVVAPMLTRLSNNNVKIESKDIGRKRKLDSNIVTAKKRRRWANKKYPDRSTSPSLGICIRQEPLQDIEGNFRCKKCECLFKDIYTLRQHIASNHRIRGHFLICLECGENFVVAPSLQMHLKAFHGITDPIIYMAQNTAYAPDMTDELEAQERITESNQCHVCMAVFEDKIALDKHFRVHGMAFLNRKRIEARNALKSPDKRGAIVSSNLNTNKVSQDMQKKNINTNTDKQDMLPESDSANVNILTRISRLLS